MTSAVGRREPIYVRAQIRQLIKGQRFSEAYELLMAALSSMRLSQPPARLLELILAFDEAGGTRNLPEQQLAWLMNERGLTLQQMRRAPEARAAFEQMLEIGRKLKDRPITRIATFNLGLVSHQSGAARAARRLYGWSLRRSVRDEDYETATKIMLNLAGLDLESGNLAGAAGTLKSIKIILDKTTDSDLTASLWLLNGQLAVRQGRFDVAEGHFRDALKYARRGKNEHKTATILQNIGAVLLDQGELKSARRWLRRASLAAAKVGSPYLSVTAGRSLAVAFLRLGKRNDAIKQLQSVRAVARRISDRRSEAMAAADLGALAIDSGKYGRAKGLLNHAFGAFRELKDADWLARTSRNLMVMSRRMKDLPAVDRTMSRALESLPASSHTLRADLLEFAGDSWLDLSVKTTAAEDYYGRAIREEHLSRDERRAAWRATRAGARLRDKRSALPAAKRLFTSALAGYTHIRDQQMAFHVRNDRALVYARLGELALARSDLKICLQLAGKQQDRTMRLRATLNLGEIERRAGNLANALSLSRDAVRLSRSLRDQRSEIDALGNLGLTYSNLDRRDDAVRTFRTLIARSKSVADSGGLATAWGGIAGIDFAKGDFKSALQHYRRALDVSSRETPDDKIHVAEDLAGILESMSALGTTRGLNSYVQELIDLTQETGQTRFGSEALARAARQLLKHNRLQTAADLYAYSIVLAPTSRFNDDFVKLLSGAVLLMTFHVEGSELRDKNAFYDRVRQRLNAISPGIGDKLKGLISLAQGQVAQTIARTR